MLRLNMSRAMKLPAAREYAIPAPFPGKYPTRVGMIVEWERGGKTGVWRYVGKPNSIAAKKFEVEVAKGGLRLAVIMEWDRAWQIASTLLSWPEPTQRGQVTNVGLQVKSPWLWTVYHPWHDQRALATAWMRQGIWVHRVSCALGENTRLYGPLPELGGIYITDYRRRVNVVGQQPAVKKKRQGLEDWTGDMRAVYAAPTPWDAPIATPQPTEPTPEPLWRRAARQAEMIRQDAQQVAAQPVQPQRHQINFWGDELNEVLGRTR